MNRKQNLVDILKKSPETLSLSQIESLLSDFNFYLQKRTRGSHRKYRRKDITLIISPHNGKVKNYQKRQIQRIFLENKLI